MIGGSFVWHSQTESIVLTENVRSHSSQSHWFWMAKKSEKKLCVIIIVVIHTHTHTHIHKIIRCVHWWACKRSRMSHPESVIALGCSKRTVSILSKVELKPCVYIIGTNGHNKKFSKKKKVDDISAANNKSSATPAQLCFFVRIANW